jgi:hypothetical protein
MGTAVITDCPLRYVAAPNRYCQPATGSELLPSAVTFVVFHFLIISELMDPLGSVVVKTLRYEPEGCGFESRRGE